jgi:predicted nucleotidyltransferase component of viral defense system
MIRQATPEEIIHYEQVVYPFQDEIFKLIQSDMFYLSGGTCLSRFYYQHRYSEDLDFFFDGYKHLHDDFEPSFRQILKRIKLNFRLELVMNGEYFKRIFVYHEQVPLKMEFIFESFKTAGHFQNVHSILLDSKQNITANKLTAIQSRKTLKDIVDLYFLLKEINFEDAVKWAEEKMVPLDYEGLLIMFANKEFEGDIILTKEIHLKELAFFTNDLIWKLFNHAKEI